MRIVERHGKQAARKKFRKAIGVAVKTIGNPQMLSSSSAVVLSLSADMIEKRLGL